MKPFRVISLFAGIGGFDLGFAQAGFEIVAHVEKDENCRALLKAKWPAALALDDVTTAGAHNLPTCDVLVGGWPCQGLSVAGLRKGLAEAHSGLFFEFTRIAHEIQPLVIVWENVPGLFTSCSCRACGRCCKGCGESAGADDEECAACGGAEFRGRVLPQHRGADFFAVVSTFGGLGFDGGWRVFDAQHFGLAQRRRRVFGVFARRNIGAVCGSEVLSLAEGVRGHPAPGRGAREGAAGDVAACLNSGGNDGGFRSEPGSHLVVEVAGDRKQGTGSEHPGVVGTLTPGAKPGGYNGQDAYTGHLIAVNTGQGFWNESEQAAAMGAGPRAVHENNPMAVCFDTSLETRAPCYTVRRLTPRECERLQGFQWRCAPDFPGAWQDELGRWWSPDWTAGFSDSVRYRMLGNAVAVPCARWLAERVRKVLLRGPQP